MPIPARFSALLLAALAALAPAAAAAQGTLTIGITQFPANFHPNIESMAAKSYVLAMTQRPFTTYDAEWELICQLCETLPSFENGLAKREPLPPGVGPEGATEGIAATYTIRKGATWGDGTPITTRDVLFTYEVGRHPLSGFSNAEMYRRILLIDAIDDKTFVMHGDRVDFNYAAINDFHILPEHIERPIFEENPAEYRNRTAFDRDPTNPALAFGPYRIDEIVTGSRISLVPNPTWWGEKPAFERIVVKVIENTAALEANLLSGEIDMIAGELGLTLDQAIAFEKRHRDKYRVIYKSSILYEHIDLMLDNPILADKRLRQALVYALDREAISQRLFDGRQEVAHGNVSPLDWVYDPEVPRYEHDPARAASLLDEAGWKLGADGVRRNADGETLSLELMTTAGNRTRELVQQVLQSQWRAAGVDISIRNEPARVFFGETVAKRRFPAMAMFAWFSSPENVPETTLSSKAIPSEANGWAGQNYTGFSNSEVDALLDAIGIELDRAKRKALWSRLQRIYAEELPAIPLYWRADAHILPKWLAGLTPTGHQYPSALWVEEWHRQ